MAGISRRVRKCRARMAAKKAANAGRQTKGVFPFLNLPTELRLEVYEAAISRPLRTAYPEGVQLDKHWLKDRITIMSQPERIPRLVTNAALLPTNKLVHAEAVEFLYGQVFTFDGNRDLHTFIVQISEHARSIRSVDFDIDGRFYLYGGTGPAQDDFMLPFVTALENFTIRCPIKLKLWNRDYPTTSRMRDTLVAYELAASDAKYAAVKSQLLELARIVRLDIEIA